MSLSTLRRRIKSDRVEFAFRYGKYFLKDVFLEGRIAISSPRTPKSSVLEPKATEDLTNTTASLTQKNEALPPSDLSAYSFFAEEEGGGLQNPSEVQASPGLSSATVTNQSVLDCPSDLEFLRTKTDYELVIKKQKTQIIKLQAELIDLKTLVMVLEK